MPLALSALLLLVLGGLLPLLACLLPLASISGLADLPLLVMSLGCSPALSVLGGFVGNPLVLLCLLILARCLAFVNLLLFLSFLMSDD